MAAFKEERERDYEKKFKKETKQKQNNHKNPNFLAGLRNSKDVWQR